MKLFSGLAALCAGALLLGSCSEKLEIAAPYKNITVVYGLLDITDTAHYIRIQKAFMDGDKSAVDMAKEADSNYYKSLEVSVTELNSNTTFPLTRVNLSDEGFTKEDGSFFTTPNYAYKFKTLLNPDGRYRLVVRNNETGEIDSSETPIINGYANTFLVTEWVAAGFAINFAKVNAPDGTIATRTYKVNLPPNATLAEMLLRFYWTDSNLTTRTAVRRSADFTGFTFNKGKGEMGYTPREIYDFLRTQVGTDTKSDVFHYFDSCDMYVYAAGQEYERYKNFNDTKGGLTGEEIKPIYTNLRGKNVMGLFNTRSHISRLNIPISQETRDSVAKNPLTNTLNIRFY